MITEQQAASPCTSAARAEHEQRRIGAEPIPGYRLIMPLGRGGFGEVWKCEAPGGVFKAIKFVCDGDSGARLAAQELEALQRVKTLRHPFILSLDRLEVVDDVLLIIMELADHSLDALAGQYAQAGAPGVPRDEVLGYLIEAAEALDWMNFEHGLQHLDVKPHNLFLVSNHVKVADFGLVSSLGEEEGRPLKTGMTPLYSAPELLRGSLSRHSDQYSLAVVYQQLLTGTVPFWHNNIYELMMQHLSAPPSLAALPEADRPVVARALSKVPEQRYPSCMEFMRALVGGSQNGMRRSGMWRRVLVGPRKDDPSLAGSLRALPGRAAPADQPTQIVPGPPGEGTAAPPPPEPSPARLASVGDAADPGGPRSPEAAGPAPTAAALPGYRFLSCLQQGPVGDLWRAEDAQGNPRRALCVLNFLRYDARLIACLQALRDPALPATEVHWSPAERLVILTECFEQTLRDHFEQCRAQGQPGVARAHLLRLLRSAADGLDALLARHGLQHLAVNPRSLMIDGERLWLADFGLIPLVWMPTGQSPAVPNSRYAAPELFDRRPSRAADQYSLALVYAEMLTGFHPRPQRPGSGSGAHRRPNGAARAQAARQAKIELDLLPSCDREVVLRALDPNPEKRYPSCTAFIEALQRAGPSARNNLYHTLPPVIPFATLMGEAVGPGTILPGVGSLVTALTTDDPKAVKGPQGARYFVQPDGSWAYRCPVPLFPGAMQLKVEGFREHWRARVIHQEGDAYRLHISVEPARGFWDRGSQPPRPPLEVEIEVDPVIGPQTRITEATVRVRYPGRDREQTDRILETMAPQVFDSVRLYFQATQEQRQRVRWPLNEPVHVYPVLPDLDLAEVLEGVVLNVSVGGACVRVARRPPADMLYLHLHASAARDHAILARVSRARETAGGVEVGAVFPTT
jgi:serine/threonine protein kinase